MRRVELHGRPCEPLPWSIRQTGVYSKLKINSGGIKVDSPQTLCPRMAKRSNFLILAPSIALNKEISAMPAPERKQESWITEAVNPWNLHKILLTEGVSNWFEYLAWIEIQLRELVSTSCTFRKIRLMANKRVIYQFNRTILTDSVSVNEATSSVLDFGIAFADRQRLQQIEDLIIDLQVILPVASDNVSRIKDACRECCQKHCAKYSLGCDCEEIMREFDETIRELDLQLKRTKSLRERATGVSKLV